MKNKINNNLVIRILRILCIVIILSFFLIALIGENLRKSVNIEKYFNSTIYQLETVGSASYLDYFPEMNGYILEGEAINNLEDLETNSSEILIVEMDKYKFSGPGLLSECKIKNVIKTSCDLHKGDNIKIYEYTHSFAGYSFDTTYQNNYLLYFDGNIPLKYNDVYVVFLNSAPNPIEEGSFIYSTDRYGAFRITDAPKVLDNYDCFEDEQLSLKEAAEYDVISVKLNEQDLKKISLFTEIYEKYSQ